MFENKSEKKSILIVKSVVGGLASTEQFLRNRGWQVQSTVSPAEAITLLAKHQPSYVLISVNHPNKKIQGLANSIRETFQCGVILFAELSDVISFKLLTDARPQLVIYPPLTGPAVERAVNKLKNGYVPSAELKSSGSVMLTQRPVANTKLETIDDSLIVTKHFHESVVFHATREALAKTSFNAKGRGATSASYSSEVVCIAIEGSDCSGYLVIATAGTEKIDDKFIRQLKIYLITGLNKRDDSISTEKDMILNLQLVPFEDWAVESAEFLRRSAHTTGEVAIAFFRNPQALTQFQASERSNMVSVKLSDIQSDSVVSCNLYLYMENNERYILYTPRGSKIYGNQIDKLKVQGISRMHILAEDTHQFNVYRAEGFLNQSITNFKRETEVEF